MNAFSSSTPKREVTGLWIGDTLPPIAELCIRSFLDHGIAFRLFTYRHYPNIPPGTLVEDASKVLPQDAIFRHDNGSLAPFADWFRNTWLEREGGFWTDLDVACLSPALPETLPWFAEQQPGLVAVGVIGFPRFHPVISKLREVSEDPAAPMPWDDADERAAKLQFQIDTPDKALRRQRAAWGSAGPEGFTRALQHFGLSGSADRSQSIYPLHYTVWRNCYNGLVQLDSPELKDAWAIHLWSELLRREPDAWENVTKGSIVGQLLDRHMPSHPTPLAAKGRKQVSILVGICSCAGAFNRREAIRNTWMRHAAPGIECVFFLGRREQALREPDVLPLWVHDDYNHLPEKVLAFFRHALEHYDFDWLFKCDDDTWIDLDRLASLPDSRYELIGDMSLQTRGAPSGGAGYLLSRALVEKIVAEPDIPLTGAEDLIFGRLAARLGARSHATDLLNLNNRPYPMSDNNLVTAHWCSPEQLQAIEAFHSQQPLAEYRGRHIHWNDTLAFYANGMFRRKTTGCAGRYVFHGPRRLTLQWFDWAPEQLTRHGEAFSNPELTLSRSSDQPQWSMLPGIEAPPDADGGPLLIHYGCAGRSLPGWVSPACAKDAIARSLPWEDDSVESFYFERIVEFLPPARAYALFEEAWRCLQPGGILLISFADVPRLKPAATLRDAICNRGYQSLWTQQTLQAILESLGFQTTGYEPGKSAQKVIADLETTSLTGPPARGTACIEAHKPHNA